MNYKLDIKPLSVNQSFKGKRYKTDTYNDFIYKMNCILPNNIFIPNPNKMSLAVEFGFSSSASDIDNCLKTFIDCLVKKYKVDDRYIYELHVFKTIVKKGNEFIQFKIY